MRFLTNFLAAITLVLLTYPFPAASVSTSEKHLVMLKPVVQVQAFLEQDPRIVATDVWDSINSFAAILQPNQITALHENPSVEAIAKDGIVGGTATIPTNARLSRVRPPPSKPSWAWGVSRLISEKPIDEKSGKLIYQHAGRGDDFGHRAQRGENFTGLKNEDVSGHGTHCAAIAAGNAYGVAKDATVIAVKVLRDDGTGYGPNRFINGIYQPTDDTRRVSDV
ncbi:hypothetical protein H0H87_003880, partial [Tephrocybe sp. NHM501043]